MGEHLTTRYNRASRNDALRISSAFHPLLTSIISRSYTFQYVPISFANETGYKPKYGIMRPVESEPTLPKPDETAPQCAAELAPESSQPTPSRLGSPTRRRMFHIFLVYLAALIAIGLVAYFQGRGLNSAEQIAQVSEAMHEQFELGIADLEAGHYEIARQRFEAIINFDPAYPGAEDMLVEALINLNVPTVTPTSEPTPTPDPSPPEALLEQAKTALADEDWDTVINKLLSLRAKDPTYQSVKVDGMMYVALRNKGMELISQGLMEEGLFNLSLAKRFGPLDRDAMFRMTLAQQYLLANSYIGLNWARASELFKPLCEQVATLDSCRKYAESAWKYGDLLWDADDPCGASEQYIGALNAYELPDLAPTASKADKVCATQSAPPPRPTATPTPSPTPTPGGNGGGS
jgi:tetratricopeptide (TPR) repeat protein